MGFLASWQCTAPAEEGEAQIVGGGSSVWSAERAQGSRGLWAESHVDKELEVQGLGA